MIALGALVSLAGLAIMSVELRRAERAEKHLLLYPQTGQAGCGCGVYRFGQKNSTPITLASTGAIYRGEYISISAFIVTKRGGFLKV